MVSQHPDWSDAVAAGLAAQLDRASGAGPEEADRIITMLARLSVQPAAADAIAAVYAAAAPEGAAVRRATLAVMRTARPAVTPRSWFDALAAVLTADPAKTTPDDVAAALQTLANLPLAPRQRAAVRPSAIRIACDPATPPRTCALALQVAGHDGGGLPPALVDRLIDLLAAGDGEGASLLDRSAATAALAAAALDEGQLTRVAATFGRLLGNDVAVLLPSFTKRGGDPLVAAVEAVGRTARPEAIDRSAVAAAVAALPAQQAGLGRDLIARIDAARAAERESYAKLAAELPSGDAGRGKVVFASSKAACTACHAMGAVGGRIGPDLTTIGAIRTPADLLEAILLPSASFVRTYDPVTIVTTEGRAFSGIIRDETATEIVLQTSATMAERILRSGIESLTAGTVSLMPKGFEQLLTPQELADLVAYLGAAK
ncbi:MAG: c-type cytochrome [Planctomycetes bacterium]|nr:c-type cytochrome [Planctomycetota bacterium]